MFWVIGFFTFLFLLFYLLILFEKSQTKWRLVAEGIFAHIEYRSRKTAFFNMALGVIYFQDKRNCIVGNFQEVPPRGTHIRVFKNKLAQFRLEVVS